MENKLPARRRPNGYEADHHCIKANEAVATGPESRFQAGMVSTLTRTLSTPAFSAAPLSARTSPNLKQQQNNNSRLTHL